MNRIRFSLRQLLLASFYIALVLAGIGTGVRLLGGRFVVVGLLMGIILVLAASGALVTDLLLRKSNPRIFVVAFFLILILFLCGWLFPAVR